MTETTEKWFNKQKEPNDTGCIYSSGECNCSLSEMGKYCND